LSIDPPQTAAKYATICPLFYGILHKFSSKICVLRQPDYNPITFSVAFLMSSSDEGSEGAADRDEQDGKTDSGMNK
jgi:hypothetical protein